MIEIEDEEYYDLTPCPDTEVHDCHIWESEEGEFYACDGNW